MIYLVRHAEAGQRTDGPDDQLRPLSAAGRRDASAIAALLAPAVDGAILSSPYVRCSQTLEPIARQLARCVETTEVLAEGALISGVRALLLEVPDNSVLCTHGDVMEALHNEFGVVGAMGADADACGKGVVWMLERDDGELSIRQVIPPSRVGALRRPALAPV